MMRGEDDVRDSDFDEVEVEVGVSHTPPEDPPIRPSGTVELKTCVEDEGNNPSSPLERDKLSEIQKEGTSDMPEKPYVKVPSCRIQKENIPPPKSIVTSSSLYRKIAEVGSQENPIAIEQSNTPVIIDDSSDEEPEEMPIARKLDNYKISPWPNPYSEMTPCSSKHHGWGRAVSEDARSGKSNTGDRQHEECHVSHVEHPRQGDEKSPIFRDEPFGQPYPPQEDDEPVTQPNRDSLDREESGKSLRAYFDDTVCSVEDYPSELEDPDETDEDSEADHVSSRDNEDFSEDDAGMGESEPQPSSDKSFEEVFEQAHRPMQLMQLELANAADLRSAHLLNAIKGHQKEASGRGATGNLSALYDSDNIRLRSSDLSPLELAMDRRPSPSDVAFTNGASTIRQYSEGPFSSNAKLPYQIQQAQPDGEERDAFTNHGTWYSPLLSGSMADVQTKPILPSSQSVRDTLIASRLANYNNLKPSPTRVFGGLCANTCDATPSVAPSSPLLSDGYEAPQQSIDDEIASGKAKTCIAPPMLNGNEVIEPVFPNRNTFNALLADPQGKSVLHSHRVGHQKPNTRMSSREDHEARRAPLWAARGESTPVGDREVSMMGDLEVREAAMDRIRQEYNASWKKLQRELYSAHRTRESAEVVSQEPKGDEIVESKMEESMAPEVEPKKLASTVDHVRVNEIPHPKDQPSSRRSTSFFQRIEDKLESKKKAALVGLSQLSGMIVGQKRKADGLDEDNEEDTWDQEPNAQESAHTSEPGTQEPDELPPHIKCYAEAWAEDVICTRALAMKERELEVSFADSVDAVLQDAQVQPEIEPFMTESEPTTEDTCEANAANLVSLQSSHDCDTQSEENEHFHLFGSRIYRGDCRAAAAAAAAAPAPASASALASSHLLSYHENFPLRAHPGVHQRKRVRTTPQDPASRKGMLRRMIPGKTFWFGALAATATITAGLATLIATTPEAVKDEVLREMSSASTVGATVAAGEKFHWVAPFAEMLGVLTTQQMLPEPNAAEL
jgi:hypothetical protein